MHTYTHTDIDWPEKLKAAGYDPLLPSCWVMEGLTMYIPTAGLSSLMNVIDKNTAPGSRIAGDAMYSIKAHQAINSDAVNRTLSKYNGELKGDGVGDAREWLCAHGWDGENGNKYNYEVDTWGAFTDVWKAGERADPKAYGSYFYGEKLLH
jgi:methyltransferase (TIGR00027 family)